MPEKAASAAPTNWTARLYGAVRTVAAGSVGATGAPHATMGQCLPQSGVGASSGQQGMAIVSAVFASEDISRISAACGASGLAAAIPPPRGEATSPNTANAARALRTTVSIGPIFTREGASTQQLAAVVVERNAELFVNKRD